jgi:hypothetical protein
MLRIVVAGLRVQSHWKPGVLRYSQTEGKENKQAKTSAGQLKEAAIGNGWHLVLGIVAEGVGLLQAFQDGAYSLQDVIGYAWVLGDPRDGRHAMVHQDLRDIPHQDHQSPGLGDALHLGLLQAPPEPDNLHQPLMVVLEIEALGLCLHQRLLTQV